MDESDLHRTWLKVVPMCNKMVRSSCLENICWRIYHLTRRKKQVSIYGRAYVQQHGAKLPPREHVLEDLASHLQLYQKKKHLTRKKKQVLRRLTFSQTEGIWDLVM